MVPAAGVAVGVVLCDARGADAVAADVCAGVRGGVFEVCFGFFVLAGGLCGEEVLVVRVDGKEGKGDWGYLVGVAAD